MNRLKVTVEYVGGRKPWKSAVKKEAANGGWVTVFDLELSHGFAEWRKKRPEDAYAVARKFVDDVMREGAAIAVARRLVGGGVGAAYEEIV